MVIMWWLEIERMVRMPVQIENEIVSMEVSKF
jgi:hypothetical protein